jgi:hypothetical protein
MVKLSASQWMHRLRLLIHGLLSRTAFRPWRTIWGFIWRHIQNIRKSSQSPKPPASISEPDHTHTKASISIPGSGLQIGILEQTRNSSCHVNGMHEPVGSLRTFDSPTYVSTSVRPYTTSPEPVGVASDDSSSEISIQVFPPDHPPSGSGDLVLNFASEQDEPIVAETGVLWNAHESLSSICLNDNASQLLSENGDHYPASHSSHSSPKSLASSTLNSRDVSLQTFSVEYQRTNRSRASVTVSPLVGADTDLSEHRSVRVDSSLEVDEHIYFLIPSNLKRYRRKRPM